VGRESVIGARLDSRRALVTGAASGIGLAVAHRLRAEGARVVLSDVRSEALEGARLEFEDGVLGLVCDVGSEFAVERLVNDAVDWLGGLDIVVTSAGIVRTALAENSIELYGEMSADTSKLPAGRVQSADATSGTAG
jgi:NAD(P)-dependent dehydrogenase (short-subunit alcohol dehydrogenase family)